MDKARYTSEPEPVLIQRHTSLDGVEHIGVTVTANATMIEADPEQWEADTHHFWEEAGNLNLEDVVAHPEAYLHYMSVRTRSDAKTQAQGMLDKLRNGCPVVPVPSYRTGASVCNRASDKTFLMGGLLLGGLATFELADGEIVSLSVDDIKLIAADVAAAETRLQLAKQDCWMEIDGAGSWEDITDALARFEAVLNEYVRTA